MKKIILLLCFIFSLNALATETYFCKDSFETLPIQQGGRVKPLYVHANETMKQLTGHTKISGHSAVVAYCLLSLQGMGLNSKLDMEARVDHVDLMEYLGLKKDEHTISYENLLNFEDGLKIEAQRKDKPESYAKAAKSLYGNLFLYKEIKSGFNWQLAEFTDNQINWVPLATYLTEAKIVEQKSISPNDPFTPVIQRSEIQYKTHFGDKFELELIYAKAKLPIVGMVLSLIALGCMVLFKNFYIALGFAGLSLLVQIALITLRIMISGRAPITNMYETVLFSGTASLFLALILGHFKKEPIYIYMGLFYNVLTMMMINFANGMLSATISPLVPVLRDNFWLSTHVTTIIASYGALALSWILANTILVKRKFGKVTVAEENKTAEIIYTTLKWGTVSLAAGIILGGVWADYSWGRFWGWDPKETWSLIVLCIYMAILHGRYTSWIRNDRFVIWTAGAFCSVMMAWFGVNYILASGLHSYGFSEGGAVFLGSFFLLQILLILLTFNSKAKAEVNA